MNFSGKWILFPLETSQKSNKWKYNNDNSVKMTQ